MLSVNTTVASGAAITHMPYARRIVLEMIDTRTPKWEQRAAEFMLEAAKSSLEKRPFAPSNSAYTRKVVHDPWQGVSIPQGNPHRDLGVLNEYWVGYRDFKTDLKDGLLQSRNGYIWKPYEPLIAECTKRGVQHDPPVWECECGIYAYDRPDHSHLKAQGGIWGEIALYGDVLRCESGYRAEMAYPLSLFMTDPGTKAVRRLKDRLEKTYGVPVFLVKHRAGQTTADLVAEFMASKNVFPEPYGE